MNVEAILRNKGRTVVTIAPDATIREAVALMKRRQIGALVVSREGRRIEGILSERDIVHALEDRGAQLLDLDVRALMSARVFTCQPEDSIAELMAQMTERRIRHLPVVERGELTGIVSIGDVVKNRLDEVEDEASSLRNFIAGG